MKYRLLYALILGAFGIILTFGCKKDKDEEPKPDPCKGQKLPSADFTADEFRQFVPDSSGDEVIDNTVGYMGAVRFWAKDSTCDTYTWIIGDHVDTLRGRVVNLDFEKPYGRIPVTLIVTKKVNKSCFPGKSDTAIKKMDVFVVDYPDLPINGRYKGAFDDAPQDSFIIKIGVDTIFGEISNRYRKSRLAITNFACPGYSVNHSLFPRGASFIINPESKTLEVNRLCIVNCCAGIDAPPGYIGSTQGYLKNGNLVIFTNIQVDEPRKITKRVFRRFSARKINS